MKITVFERGNTYKCIVSDGNIIIDETWISKNDSVLATYVNGFNKAYGCAMDVEIYK